jgi:hypothetical protein
MTERPEDLQATALAATGNGRVVLVVEDEADAASRKGREESLRGRR